MSQSLEFGPDPALPLVECPHCLADLRLPSLGELYRLAAVLSQVEGATAVELQCQKCGGVFSLPTENYQQDKKKEFDDLLGRIIRGE